MAKNLLIVESPAKTRTLKKFLGRQYAVEASLGHIRDLVKKDMGIGPQYEPKYEVLKDKKEVVKNLPGEIVAALPRGTPRAPEELAILLSTPVDRVLGALLELELGGWVKRLPGGVYGKA